MTITSGIDWAEKHHDVTLVDEDGGVLVHRRITTDAADFTALMTLLTEHGATRLTFLSRSRQTRTWSWSASRLPA